MSARSRVVAVLCASAATFSTASAGTYVDVVPGGVDFSALSGLALVPAEDDAPAQLFSIPDGAVSPSRIYRLSVGDPTTVVAETILTRDGAPVSYDLEGIDVDYAGGWWVVSEGAGNAPSIVTPNLLIHVGADGAVLDEIALPAEVAQFQSRFGLEGVAASKDGAYVYVEFQNEWQDDPSRLIRIGRYAVTTGEWTFYHYERDLGPGRVGLSELTRFGDHKFIVIERDNQLPATAQVKRLYVIDVKDVEPAPAGWAPPVLEKTLLRDLLEDGWPHEKAEGTAILGDDVLVMNDNDGEPGGPTEILILEDLVAD